MMSNILIRTVCPYCHKEQRNCKIEAFSSADNSVVVMNMTIWKCTECFKKYAIVIPETFESSEIQSEVK